MNKVILIVLLISTSDALQKLAQNRTPPNYKRFLDAFAFHHHRSVSPCAVAFTTSSTTPAPIPLLVGPLCRVIPGSGGHQSPPNIQSPPSQLKPTPSPGGIFVGVGSLTETTTFIPTIQIPEPTTRPPPIRPERIPGQPPKILQHFTSGQVIVPFIPPGFSYANPLLTFDTKCPLSPSPNKPLCSTMDTLDKLQLRKIHNYIHRAGLEQLFHVTFNYTFFAPSDPAFAVLPQWFLSSLETDVKLLRALILNHFVKEDVPLGSLGNDFLILNSRPGGNRIRSNVYFSHLPYRTYTLDGSRVILGDLQTNNGRLNILDKVVVPNPRRNAAQYIQQVPQFSDFLSVVMEANMMEVLEGSDPITLFIPYNEAFATFDLETLRGNGTSMRNFVNYHVVPGTFYSNGLMDGQYVTTLFDKEVKLSVTSDGFTKTLRVVNNVNRVLKADIPLLNGVAHVIGGALSTVPDFYFYEHLTEFPSLNFGTLRRQFSVSDNQI